MSVHPQVVVQHPLHGGIEVDELLQTLLPALWSRGIETVMSCQDSHHPEGWVWLCFRSGTDAEAFLNTVAADWDDDPESMYQRARATYADADDLWQVTATAEDQSIGVVIDEHGTVEDVPRPDLPPMWQVSVSLRFPAYDLREVSAAFGL